MDRAPDTSRPYEISQTLGCNTHHIGHRVAVAAPSPPPCGAPRSKPAVSGPPVYRSLKDIARHNHNWQSHRQLVSPHNSSSRSWSTAMRDWDDHGPFGCKGPYGVEGPPAPHTDRQNILASRRRIDKELRRFRGQQPMTHRPALFVSTAETSWSKLVVVPPIRPVPPLRENSHPEGSPTSRRPFINHPAVQPCPPHKVESLHAMGAWHPDITYRVNCAAARGT